MFDLGWSEIALIAVVAFVLLGPQDLVRVMRRVGYWVQKARLTMVTFQRMLEAAAYDEEMQRMQAELRDLKNTTEDTMKSAGAPAASPARMQAHADTSTETEVAAVAANTGTRSDSAAAGETPPPRQISAS